MIEGKSFMDQDTARAYCDAGYMTLSEYLRLFEANGWQAQGAKTAPTQGPDTPHASAVTNAIAQLRAFAFGDRMAGEKAYDTILPRLP